MNTLPKPIVKRKARRLIKRVELRFFCDDATGEYGLTHKDTIDNDNGFNAFWNGQGLFHDIFEHSHEHIDEHFRGEYAMNVGGEITAMGALWYYYGHCGMHTRLNNNYHSADENIISTTHSFIQEAIEDGNFQFGNVLLCNIPNQKPIDDSSLESIINEHFDRINESIVNKRNQIDDENVIKYCKEYKDSCTLEKLQNFYRYGFNLAKKLIPDNWQNNNMLNEFMPFWDDFCKRNSAEEMSNQYRGLTFSLYRESGGIISWKAEFIPQETFDDSYVIDKWILRSNEQ